MARRIASSSSAAGPQPERNKARTVRSAASSQSASERRASSRTVSSRSAKERAAAAQPGKRASRTVAGRADTAGSGPIRNGFVDARRMPSEDAVSKTLDETAGLLGIPTRPKIVDFAARLKERRRASLRIVITRALALIAAIVAIGVLVWFLFLSPTFTLETSRISVTGGNEWVSRDDIVAIADKQSGKSLLLVSSDEVVRQLQNIPGVTEATVNKRFPNGLAITVRAQQPAAMLKESDNRLVAVDSQARVLNTVGDASTDGIPIIEVKDIDAGLDSKAVQEALKILGGLPDSLRSTITKVTANTQDSITTELNGGEHTVIWGDASDLTLKQAIVDKILSDPKVIGDKKQVDVSAPSRPIIK